MTPTHEPPEMRDTAELAALGLEMDRILETEAFQTAITLAKARIYADFCTAVSDKHVIRAKREQQALERLLGAISDITQDGFVAREAIRRANAVDDEGDFTDLPE